MATLASAQEKYARKGATAAQNYNAAKGRMTANWGPGFSEFIGAPVSASRSAAYAAGVQAAQYRPGDPAKWAARLRQAMTGG